MTRQQAIRAIWRVLNAESRGKVTQAAALGAIQHAALRGLQDRMPEARMRYVGGGRFQPELADELRLIGGRR